MTEQPLFQNTDEQEARYAPQQLPEGSAAERTANLEEGAGGDSDLPNVGLLPGAAAVGANTGGTGPATGAGTLSGVAPVVAGDALDDPAIHANEQDRRDENH